MSNEPKSDDELARDFERILESEHPYRLLWMQATGRSYDEAVQTFEEAKARAVRELVDAAKAARILADGAAGCTCDMYRFPQNRRPYLKGTKGPHHTVACPQWTN